MIGTWIDEGLEYFDVARGIKPDSKIFLTSTIWSYHLSELRSLFNRDLAYRVDRAGYIPPCWLARWTKREIEIGCSAEYFLLFQRGFRIHKW